MRVAVAVLGLLVVTACAMQPACAPGQYREGDRCIDRDNYIQPYPQQRQYQQQPYGQPMYQQPQPYTGSPGQMPAPQQPYGSPTVIRP